MSLRHHKRGVGMFLVVVGLFVLSTTAEAKQENTHQIAVPPSEFVLIVDGDDISLKSEGAALEAILTAMGEQMGMEILGEIPKREPITTEFEGLSLAEAMHHLGLNYGYQLDPGGITSNTNKLFILPRRQQTAFFKPQNNAVEPRKELVKPIVQWLGDSESGKEKETGKDDSSRPAPFQFQFDPSAFAE